MDTVEKAELALFVAAWIALAAVLLPPSMIQPSTSFFLFSFLLLLSAMVFASKFVDRRLRLQTKGKFVMILVIVSLLIVFFAPAVQTMPTAGGSGSVCKGGVCSSIEQWASLTDRYYCVGTKYQFDSIDGLIISFDTGCPPPML